MARNYQLNKVIALAGKFIVVAEEKHFRRAAERLHISQPPLSQAIQHLESELGVRLFNRTNRSVQLTEAGTVFFTEIHRALDQIDIAVTAARRTALGLVGRLRVSFNRASSFEIVPWVVQNFRAEVPDVEFDMREMPTASQVRALIENRLDVAFLREVTFDEVDIVFEPLWEDRFVVVLPEGHRLASSAGLDLRELEGEPFIITFSREGRHYLGPTLHAQIVNACQQAGFTPRIVQEADHSQTICNLVSTGMGVGLVPGSISNTRHVGVVYKELRGTSPPLKLKLGMAWNKKNPSPILPAFLEMARQVAVKKPPRCSVVP